MSGLEVLAIWAACGVIGLALWTYSEWDNPDPDPEANPAVALIIGPLAIVAAVGAYIDRRKRNRR